VQGTYGTIGHVASEYLSTGAAAAELGVTPTTLLDWLAKGIVTPAQRTAGGHYRWRIDDLRRQLAERKDQQK
jgi:DNA-binding transcriptional MerR regulator